jgi:tetratricopeptide (TPR) repeat protein
VCRAGAGPAGDGTALDIRTEDHDDPIAELRRLNGVWGTLMKMLRYLDWWEALADGYLSIGRYDAAIAAYRTYLAINPGLGRIIAQNARRGRFPVEVARELGVMG